YVEVAELDGKVVAAFGAMGADLGDCNLTLLAHRDSRWLIGARGEPLSEGKAGTVPSRAVQSIVVGGALTGKPALLWSGQNEDQMLRLGFADARGYAFDFADLQAEHWLGAGWRGSANAVIGTPLSCDDESGVAFGDGALFVAAQKRGLFVV